ncbi:MAG: exodeoxyribonuclease VII small subunit [Planctomycetes bacterium]|nr:exodeoxyribonuclease VII small subunit [Planctomycetota bacterium]
MSFEQATEELEAIIERIEAGEIGLEASLAERRRGEALIKRSREILDAAEEELKRVEVGEGDEPDGD